MSASTAQDEARRLVDLGLLRASEASEILDSLGNGTGKDLIDLLERRQVLTPFQIQKLDAGETTGYFVGRYKLLYLIAGGTFARVFRAIDPNTGEVMAVKILRAKHMPDPTKVKQFHREGRLTEDLQHPNVTRTREVGTDPVTQQHYIAMDFIEGGNLREFIRIRKKLDPSELVRLGTQMVDGLRYALGKGLTHRDIKPTNILISAAGDIKWVDFGLGGVVEEQTKAGDQGQRTVDYAALERATGAPKGDPRSDIFFLGVVFFELLTGEHPMGDRSSRSVPRFDMIPTLASRDGIPRSLAVIIDKMLSYRPERRYQDYDSLLDDLRKANVESNTPAAAASNGPPRVVVIHQSMKVQEILKGKLNRRGFQAVVTSDVGRALVLCKMKPAECAIIDLDTTGREGVHQFCEMQRNGFVQSAIFLVSEGQSDWLSELNSERVIQLGKPLILGPVYQSVRALVGRVEHDSEAPAN